MRKWLAGIALGCATLLPGGCALDYAFLFPPLEVVEEVDLERYAGTWYEIAKYPTPFQAGCARSTAEYTPQEGGRVRVLNTCESPDGTVIDTIEGYAEVADPATNAKLTVYFPGSPFGAPYWILELGEDYGYAVVGEPSRSFLWILSRTPTMDEATFQSILTRLPEKGYDPGRLQRVSESTAPAAP